MKKRSSPRSMASKRWAKGTITKRKKKKASFFTSSVSKLSTPKKKKIKSKMTQFRSQKIGAVKNKTRFSSKKSMNLDALSIPEISFPKLDFSWARVLMKKISVLLLFLGLAVGASFFLYSEGKTWMLSGLNEFKVKEIEVELPRGFKTSADFKAEILKFSALSGLGEGVGLFSFDPEKVISRIESHPWIHKVSVSRLLTGKVQLLIKPQKALWIWKNQGKLKFLNFEADPFAGAQTRDLLRFPVLSGVKHGELQNALIESEEILRVFQQSGTLKRESISELVWNAKRGSRLIVSQGGRSYEITLGKGELEKKVALYSKLKPLLKEKGVRPVGIDLLSGKRGVIRTKTGGKKKSFKNSAMSSVTKKTGKKTR